MLWDLAGQPGYRIVHQLHLEGAALALILFDAKSETTPLAGVQHWARAVRHAHPAADGGLPTFLVAARADRGGINVSDQRIQKLMADFGLDQYFKTSAKEGTDTDLLRSRLLAAIDWSRIPEVTSTTLFAAVKKFVVEQKSQHPADPDQRTVPAVPGGGAQRRAVADRAGAPPEPADDDPPAASPARLTSVFEGCIARLESAGLVKRLKFGDYVLLQPELLDAYAGAMVNAARDEPDGLGSILETKVVNVDFPVPATERVRDRLQERLLVLATLEELLLHELVLREPTKDGVQLVFPSAYRRDLPTSEMPNGRRGRLPVRGADREHLRDLDRPADPKRPVQAGGHLAVGGPVRRRGGHVHRRPEIRGRGRGRAADRVRPGTRRHQEAVRALRAHAPRALGRRRERITRERQYSCPDCGVAFTPEMIRQVVRLGRPSILCPVCEERVPLRDDYEVNGTDQSTAQMDASADAGREIEAATAVLRGRPRCCGAKRKSPSTTSSFPITGRTRTPSAR